ncbi:MAG: hypothetical protein ACJ77K_10125 [Bacteroidia bacterium]
MNIMNFRIIRASLVLLFCFSTLFSAGQKIICFADDTKVTSNARYAITNAVCLEEVIKAKVKITNLTDQTLLVKPEECFFTTAKGNLFSHDRWVIIGPHGEETKVIDAKGDMIQCKEATLNMNGIYTCSDTQITVSPAIKLKPEKEIRVGNFILELDQYDQDKTEIVFKYKVTYTGNQVGLCRPGKATVKSSSGKEFKNFKEIQRTVLFKKNDDFLVGFTFSVDSKKDDHVLYLNDMLTESTPVKAGGTAIALKYDEVKTLEKNK